MLTKKLCDDIVNEIRTMPDEQFKEELQLSKDNQFNGMDRNDFKQMLISMGFKVEDCNGTGRIEFEDDDK